MRLTIVTIALATVSNLAVAQSVEASKTGIQGDTNIVAETQDGAKIQVPAPEKPRPVLAPGGVVIKGNTNITARQDCGHVSRWYEPTEEERKRGIQRGCYLPWMIKNLEEKRDPWMKK